MANWLRCEISPFSYHADYLALYVIGAKLKIGIIIDLSIVMSYRFEYRNFRGFLIELRENQSLDHLFFQFFWRFSLILIFAFCFALSLPFFLSVHCIILTCFSSALLVHVISQVSLVFMPSFSLFYIYTSVSFLSFRSFISLYYPSFPLSLINFYLFLHMVCPPSRRFPLFPVRRFFFLVNIMRTLSHSGCVYVCRWEGVVVPVIICTHPGCRRRLRRCVKPGNWFGTRNYTELRAGRLRGTVARCTCVLYSHAIGRIYGYNNTAVLTLEFVALTESWQQL